MRKPIEEWQLPLKFSPVVFSITTYYSERVEAFLSALQNILRTHHLLLNGNWWTYQGILRHQHCPALLGTFKQGFHNPGQSAQTDGPLLLYWHFNRVWLWSQTDESDRMSWNKPTGGVEVKGCFVQKWYSSHGPLTTVKKHLLTKSICGMFLWTATLTTCF